MLSWYHTWSAAHRSHGKVLFDICYRRALRRVTLQLLPLTHGEPEKIYLLFFFAFVPASWQLVRWTVDDLLLLIIGLKWRGLKEKKRGEAAPEFQLGSVESQSSPPSQLIKMTFIANWSNGIWWAAGECWFYAMRRPPEKERLRRRRVKQLTRYRGYATHTEAAKTINQK